MICPNCGSDAPESANFCQNCSYRFDSVPQSEPIRIVIAQPPEAQTATPVMLPPVVVKQRVESTSNNIVKGLTVLVVLLFICGAGLLGYIFVSGQRHSESTPGNVNTYVVTANTNGANLAAAPSPTTYEDLKNKIAPPAQSTKLIDEEFGVESGAHRAIPFSITDRAGARLAGGFRVTRGRAINFYVYPADAYNQYPTNGLKPVHLEQTHNKILNERLKMGDYYLVFENNDQQSVTVATELLLVTDGAK